MATFIAAFSQAWGPIDGYGFEEEITDSGIVNYAQALARGKKMELDFASQGRPDIKLRTVRFR
jgi:hypothetical protein